MSFNLILMRVNPKTYHSEEIILGEYDNEHAAMDDATGVSEWKAFSHGWIGANESGACDPFHVVRPIN